MTKLNENLSQSSTSSGNCSAPLVVCYLVSRRFTLSMCISLSNQCLKRIPTQVWNHPSLCSHLLSGVLACKDLLPRFPKFQIRFPYLCDIFLLHVGCPPWDMVQRVLLDRMSEQPGLFHVFPSSRRLPFLLFVFLSENSCLCFIHFPSYL